uniref:Dynein regulatory complex subunit 2 n=1 Tax=Mucochytrium quahogii TaxID=96639 RepID=A0A7S2RYX4_9STRA|mmetsp:Transcript_22197/g.48264  ORF Transcript_22197/g.48264 Transcript_22197/m.48264 type:complete len:545 (+) Transcript_22197:574-2208(+)
MALLGKDVKGKKGKKPKKENDVTEADKAAEEKKRRLKENDMRKKLALNARNQLIADMKEELKNTQVNKLRIQNQWRKVMRLAKVESLRKDIEVLSQNHERDVDRKDAIIQMLDRDLEEAEDQYQTALRSHLQNIDRLIDLQDSRLLALENEFESELAEIASEFNVERDQIITQHQFEKKELLDIIAAVGAEEQDREAEARQEHEQTREEIRNKNLEDINVLRITLESTIEELERHFESAHLNYLQNTDQRTQDFKFLTRKDQELSKEIEVKIRKIERLQTSLSHWRTKIAQNTKECEDRNSALREEKDQIAKHFLQLKTRMNKFRDRQAKRLTDLTRSTCDARKRLNKKTELGKRILKLAELARKLETEQEKISPFYQSSVVPTNIANKRPVSPVGENAGEGEEDQQEEATGTKALLQQQEPKALLMKKARALGPDGELLDEWESLDNFFKRFNKVMLSKLAVDKEKDRLAEENQTLQILLKQYLDGITVRPEVMDNKNPLLVVNGRVNITKQAMVRGSVNGGAYGRPTIVDGNHMVATHRTSP